MGRGALSDLSLMVGGDEHEHRMGVLPAQPAGRPDNRVAGSRLCLCCAGAPLRCQGALRRRGVPFLIQQAKGLAPHYPRIH